MTIDLDDIRTFFEGWRDEAARTPYDNGTGDLAANGLLLLDEVVRLQTITANVRRCPNCHKEVLNGRAVVDVEPDEEWGISD